MASHFYTTTHGVEEEPDFVRVGVNADPISEQCFPRGAFGASGADYTTSIATYYPVAGTTNEIGGGNR